MNINQLQKYLYVYCTPFPNTLYCQASNHGNMAFAGIGLGLIRCQIYFWITSIISILSLFLIFNYNINYNLINGIYCLLIINMFIINRVLAKTNYLIQFLVFV
jgi:hypothetical protein